MQGGDSPEYETTTVTLTKQQKEWLDEHSEVNVSGLVRDVIGEAHRRGDFTAADLEGLLAELRLLRSRCETYEEQLTELR